MGEQYPNHIREKMHNGEELTRDEVVEWHKCVAVHWMKVQVSVEHGGTGWDATKKIYPYLRELA